MNVLKKRQQTFDVFSDILQPSFEATTKQTTEIRRQTEASKLHIEPFNAPVIWIQIVYKSRKSIKLDMKWYIFLYIFFDNIGLNGTINWR